MVAGIVSGRLEAHLVVRRSDAFSLDVTLSIAPGQTVALLGPNGAGKSTAVSALAGILPLDSGRIELDGHVLDDPREGRFVPPDQRSVGVVFQDYVLFPHLTVADNVAFGLRSRGLSRSRALAEAHDVLEQLGVKDLGGRKPRQISGGEAQRVALGRALATEPRLLLLDEPLSALDATTRAELRRVLADSLSRFDRPRLLITHDPTEAFLLADEIYVVENGSVTQSGTAEDIRLRPRTSYVADLAGVNLVVGVASAGRVRVGGHELRVGDSLATGPVLATIHPRAISLHRQEPEGSPRNAWPTRVRVLEHYGDRVRVLTEGPLPLIAEVTPAAESALDLAVGLAVWVSIKATEIGVEAR
jgi:molybdate transport system ATP-binding protein